MNSATSSGNSENRPQEQALQQARAKGTLALLGQFVRMSGPGWLQSAVTLGGGTLIASLYIGVLGGYQMMWLQPLALAMGIVMLAAISYVTLSTGERPFHAIKNHVNPVLAWGWIIATLAANLVWAMPQFSLATAALEQNLLPGVFGKSGPLGENGGTAAAALAILALAVATVWSQKKTKSGSRPFDFVLKAMVAGIVVSFVAVTLKLGLSDSGLPMTEVFAGFVPDFTLLWTPAKQLQETIAQTGTNADFWTTETCNLQRSVMIAAAGAAVGINMTFLLPYSMLNRGWNREFRGLAIFDLLTGLMIPFVLATFCVILASCAQFHNQPAPGFLGEVDTEGKQIQPDASLKGQFDKTTAQLIEHQVGKKAFAALSDAQLQAKRDALPEADRRVAAMLVKRDAFQLAKSLAPLLGAGYAQVIFGLGVFAIGISSIIGLMLINGFVLNELLGASDNAWCSRIGALMVGGIGVLGPFVFQGDAKTWLAIPTSVIGFILLPTAYIAFLFMMNSRSLLKDAMPTGFRRVVWNTLMGLTVVVVSYAALWETWRRAGFLGISAFAGFLILALVVHLRTSKHRDGA